MLAIRSPATSAHCVSKRLCAKPRLSDAVRMRFVKRLDVRLNPFVVARRGGIRSVLLLSCAPYTGNTAATSPASTEEYKYCVTSMPWKH